MMRSGRIRRELRTRSRMLIWPLPSTLEGRLSSVITWDCWSWSSAESSIVTMRSPFGMSPDSALRRVVLPVPVAPETITLNLARTSPARSISMCSSSEPSPIISWSVNALGKRRMVRIGPLRESGGMITLTRSPEGSRASTIGFASSTRRLTVETMRSMVCISCSLDENRIGSSSRRPRRSTYTCSCPLTMISLMEASSRSGSRMPSPRDSSTTRRMSCERSIWERTGPSRLMMWPRTRSSRARRSAAARADISARSISSRSLAR